MEPSAQDTCGMKELLAVRAAIRAAAELARPPGSPAALVQVAPDGPGLGTVHALTTGPLVLGRGTAAELGVADPSVSRAHARLALLASGRLSVADLGSANGTFVNERPVADAEAEDGDFVRFGLCVFRFQAATPAAGPPTPPSAGTPSEHDPTHEYAVPMERVGRSGPTP